jgi:hypothetical protein
MFILYILKEDYKAVVEALTSQQSGSVVVTLSLFARHTLITCDFLAVRINFNRWWIIACEFHAYLLQGKSSSHFENIYF